MADAEINIILKDDEIFVLISDQICLSQLAVNGTTNIAQASYCRRYHILVEIFLAGYLIIGNILLLNLLIAIFSNVFKSIDDNSIELWKYQMYAFTMEYNSKTALVPPLSILEHIFLFVRWLIRTVCCFQDKKEKQFSNRHLEYLHLFEKEEMSTCLRKQRDADQSSQEKISKLQKRVDEQFHQLGEEFFAEAEDNRVFQNEIKEDMEQLKETLQNSIYSMDTLGFQQTRSTATLPEKSQNVQSDKTANPQPKTQSQENIQGLHVENSSKEQNEIIMKEEFVPEEEQQYITETKKQNVSKTQEENVLGVMKEDENTQVVDSKVKKRKKKQKEKKKEIKEKENTETDDKISNLNNLSEPKYVSEKNIVISELEPSRMETPQPVLTRETSNPVSSMNRELQKRMSLGRMKQMQADQNIATERIYPVNIPKRVPPDITDSDSSDDDFRKRRLRHHRSRDSSDERERRRKYTKKQLYRENTEKSLYRENTDDWYM